MASELAELAWPPVEALGEEAERRTVCRLEESLVAGVGRARASAPAKVDRGQEIPRPPGTWRSRCRGARPELRSSAFASVLHLEANWRPGIGAFSVCTSGVTRTIRRGTRDGSLLQVLSAAARRRMWAESGGVCPFPGPPRRLKGSPESTAVTLATTMRACDIGSTQCCL